MSGSLELVVERRERETTPHREFQIGRIVDGEPLRSCEAERLAPGPDRRLVVDGDGEWGRPTVVSSAAIWSEPAERGWGWSFPRLARLFTEDAFRKESPG